LMALAESVCAKASEVDEEIGVDDPIPDELR